MDIQQFVKENLGKEIAFKNCDNPKGTAIMKGMIVGYDSCRIEILVSYTNDVGWSPAEIIDGDDVVLLHSPLNKSYGYIFHDKIIDSPKTEESVYAPILPITWKGKEYTSKTLVIFKDTKDEEVVTVSIIELEKELIDDETGAPVSNEAEEVDGDIYYYLSKIEMLLPDNDIIAIIEKAQ
ncbi:hypothetical protein DW228_06270 [Bacteroides fragilis]|uniref:Uncharacterized protein n=1 Tax=Bacteroides fragilis TaxID=817 RepID=A0A396C6Q4_BACFG|nr:hypothetical protein [Bacteroides fragilis]RHH14402.1 hypothetical protein DW228_06270 [Bacteroides fragilis]